VPRGLCYAAPVPRRASDPSPYPGRVELTLREAVLGVLAGASGFVAVILSGSLLARAVFGAARLEPASPAALVLQATAHLTGAAMAVAAVWARRADDAGGPTGFVFRLLHQPASGRPGRRRLLGAAGVGFVAGLGLQFPLAELGNVVAQRFPLSPETQAFLFRLSQPSSVPELLATLLAIVLAAPLAEEVVFRGLLVVGLRRAVGVGPAIVGSSVLFGLVHGHPTAIAYATTAGLVLGLLAARTGSIALGVAVHAGVNALPLLLPGSLVEVPGLNTQEVGRPHLPLGWLLAGSGLGALGLFAASRLADGPGGPRQEDGKGTGTEGSGGPADTTTTPSR